MEFSMQAMPDHIPSVVGICRVGGALRTAARLEKALLGGALKAATVGTHAGRVPAGLATAGALRTAAGLDMGRTVRTAAGLEKGVVGSALKAAAGPHAGGATAGLATAGLLRTAAGLDMGRTVRTAAGLDMGRTVRMVAGLDMGRTVRTAAGLDMGRALRTATGLQNGVGSALKATVRLHAGGATARLATAGLLRTAAGLDVGRTVRTAAGLDMGRTVRTAAGLEEGVVGSALKAAARPHVGGATAGLAMVGALGTVAGLDARSSMKAVAGIQSRLVASVLRASAMTGVRGMLGTTVGVSADRLATVRLPRFDPHLFSEKWDERVAAAIARLERAEDVIDAAPEPERAVEVLAADTDTVVEATSPVASERVDRWVQWVWLLLAQKLFLDPVLDPAIEAAREAVLRVIFALAVIVTPSAPAVPPLPPSSTHLEPESPNVALTIPGKWAVEGVPMILRRAGPKAVDRMIEFFTQENGSDPGTRAGYEAAATRFLAWCDERRLALEDISPVVVTTYIETMQGVYSAATIQQHMGAIRRVFDWLEIGQVVPMNPAGSQ